MENKRKVGNYYEREAEIYVTKLGYNMRDMNVFTPFGELDLIVQKDNVIYFIEVKYRSAQSIQTAREAIHQKKQKTLVKCAVHYLKTHHIGYMKYKIGFMGITRDNTTLEFDFIEDIFY